MVSQQSVIVADTRRRLRGGDATVIVVFDQVPIVLVDFGSLGVMKIAGQREGLL